MTILFYIGFAINAVVLLGILGLSLSGLLREFQSWIDGLWLLLALWTAGSWALLRIDRPILASLMTWIPAILVPAALAAIVFLAGWLQNNFKSGFR